MSQESPVHVVHTARALGGDDGEFAFTIAREALDGQSGNEPAWLLGTAARTFSEAYKKGQGSAIHTVGSLVGTALGRRWSYQWYDNYLQSKYALKGPLLYSSNGIDFGPDAGPYSYHPAYLRALKGEALVNAVPETFAIYVSPSEGDDDRGFAFRVDSRI